MIRVLHIAPTLDFGGISSVIMNYYQCLYTGDIHFDVLGILSPNAPREKELNAMGGHYYYLGTFSNLHLFSNMIKWIVFFKKQKYDIIHAHCNLVSAWILLAARLAGCKVRIAHSHSTGLIWGGKLQTLYVQLRRLILKHSATLCLACSHEAGCVMYGSNSHFTILPNGIHLDKYLIDKQHKQVVINEFHIHSSQQVFAMIARISTVKNHPFALEVFHHIHTINPNATLIIGGPDNSNDPTESGCQTETALQQKIKEYHLEDAVHIVGARQDMESIYAITDCWLFPSLYEGFPLGLLELQASGTPVIVSDVVTRQVDMGLGLLTFMSLNDSYQSWANIALTKKHQDISHQHIQNAFQAHQLDIHQNAQSLYQLYHSML